VTNSNAGLELFMTLLTLSKDEEKFKAEQALAQREMGIQEQLSKERTAASTDERTFAALTNAQQQLGSIGAFESGRILNRDVPEYQSSLIEQMTAGSKAMKRELGGLSDLLNPTVKRSRDFDLVEGLRSKLTPDLLEKAGTYLSQQMDSGNMATAHGASETLKDLLDQAGAVAAEDEGLTATVEAMRKSVGEGLGGLDTYDPAKEVLKYQQSREDTLSEQMLGYQAGLNQAKIGGPGAVLEYTSRISAERSRGRNLTKSGVMGPPVPSSGIKFNPIAATSITPPPTSAGEQQTANLERVFSGAAIKPQPTYGQAAGEAVSGLVGSSRRGYYQGDGSGVALSGDALSIIRKAAMEKAASTTGRKGVTSPSRSRGVSQEAERLVAKADLMLLEALKRIPKAQEESSKKALAQQIANLIKEGKF
jgi:hypothetical protein